MPRLPDQSVYHVGSRYPGAVSQAEECGPEVWLGSSASRTVEVLTEQVLEQQNGHAMLMLHAELRHGDDR